jgi:hypothetical protein
LLKSTNAAQVDGLARCRLDLVAIRHVKRSTVIPVMAESSVSFSGRRIVAMTFQPRSANSMALARPSPVELPLMKMVYDIECLSTMVQRFCARRRGQRA